jgi:hypothetical protein
MDLRTRRATAALIVMVASLTIARLPNHNTACQTRLSQFFRQWFDAAYDGSKPQITGPGLHGHAFYAHGCPAPRRR